MAKLEENTYDNEAEIIRRYRITNSVEGYVFMQQTLEILSFEITFI